MRSDTALYSHPRLWAIVVGLLGTDAGLAGGCRGLQPDMPPGGELQAWGVWWGCTKGPYTQFGAHTPDFQFSNHFPNPFPKHFANHLANQLPKHFPKHFPDYIPNHFPKSFPNHPSSPTPTLVPNNFPNQFPNRCPNFLPQPLRQPLPQPHGLPKQWDRDGAGQ